MAMKKRLLCFCKFLSSALKASFIDMNSTARLRVPPLLLQIGARCLCGDSCSVLVHAVTGQTLPCHRLQNKERQTGPQLPRPSHCFLAWTASNPGVYPTLVTPSPLRATNLCAISFQTRSLGQAKDGAIASPIKVTLRRGLFLDGAGTIYK